MALVHAHTPNELDLVIDFVNTFDPDDGTDALATTGGLGGWLGERDLITPDDASLTDSDLQVAIRLREALRALMLENNGEAADPGAARELELTAQRGQLGVHFGADGSVAIRPAAGGLAGALASLLVPVADARRDGSWHRVKACRASDCQWAFYDRSRNRSGVWCDMAVCGNRHKVRAYRAREPRQAGTPRQTAAPRQPDRPRKSR
jgi:predicted RNA-binding Zn ribbon-like protein